MFIMKQERNYFDVNENEYDAAANAILSGAVSADKTEGLIVKIEDKVEGNNLIAKASLEETRVVDEFDNMYAVAHTTVYSDVFSDKLVLKIEDVRSFPVNSGNFSILLRGVERCARREGISALTLEVDEHNTDAIDKYEHKGFYETGRSEFTSDNTDRIYMRKDLI